MIPATEEYKDQCKLVVTNLPYDVNGAALFELFQSFGECKLNHKTNDLYKTSFATVIYETPINAESAYKALNFNTNLGKEMLISIYDSRMRKHKEGNIFIKNLPVNITHKEIFDLFKEYGKIYSVRLAQDYDNESKGYGFIQFYSKENSKRAIREMNNKIHKDHKLIVDAYRPEVKHSDTYTNIYIKNLPSGLTTKEELEELFGEYGEITSSGIFPREYKGKVYYFGFINFKESENAARAVLEMNGKVIKDSKLFVTKALNNNQFKRDKLKYRITQKSLLKDIY